MSGGGQPCAQPGARLLQVMFSEEALPKGKGEYILGYYSNTSSSIVGVTEPFQVSNASRQRVGGGRFQQGRTSCLHPLPPQPPVWVRAQC